MYSMQSKSYICSMPAEYSANGFRQRLTLYVNGEVKRYSKWRSPAEQAVKETIDCSITHWELNTTAETRWTQRRASTEREVQAEALLCVLDLLLWQSRLLEWSPASPYCQGMTQGKRSTSFSSSMRSEPKIKKKYVHTFSIFISLCNLYLCTNTIVYVVFSVWQSKLYLFHHFLLLIQGQRMNAVFYDVLFIMSFLMMFTHVHIYWGKKILNL